MALRIVAWNANGLYAKLDQVKVFLSEYQIDILLISETHLTDKNRIKIPHYTLFQSNHPHGKAHGGTAVAIKNDISHHLHSEWKEVNIQATAITVITNKGQIQICSIYVPPNHKINSNTWHTLFNSLGNKFIMAGDYNAKHPAWGSRIATSRGKTLYASLTDLRLLILSSNEPTHWPYDTNRLPDIIDFGIAKGVDVKKISVYTTTDLNSDHSPLFLNLYEQIIYQDQPLHLTNKTTNWNNFREHINLKLNCNIPLKTPLQLEEATSTLTEAIHEAAWTNTKYAKRTVKNAIVPKHILELIKKKRAAKRNWQTFRTENHKKELNYLSKIVSRKIAEFRNENFNSFLNKLSATQDTNYSLWQVTKKVLKVATGIPPLKTANSTWLRTDQDKAEAFARHLEDTFRPHDLQSTVPPISDTFTASSLTPPPRITQKEVAKIIKNLKTNKSPGFDLINGRILKELPPKAIRFLTIIYNRLLRLNYFPHSWKIAKMVMLPKPGKNPHEITSYRPISLLPLLSKIFETILLSKMKETISEKQLIPEHQFGFRNKHSTVQQTHRIVNSILEAIETKQYCTALFLDIEKAFDKVWHEGLLEIIKNKFPNYIHKTLQSYLSKRSFYVSINNACSDIRFIKAGVPQGSVLGPILYTLFTANIPTTSKTKTYTFADDTAIIATSANPTEAVTYLQQHINLFETWMKEKRIKANPTKCSHMTFTLNRQNIPNIFLNNITIPQVTQVRYLGLHLDSKLKWNHHIKTKIKQIKLRRQQIPWLVTRKSKLTPENKLLLYKVIFKPIWTYGIQLWGMAAKSHISKLEALQHIILRTVVNAPWYIRNDQLRHDLKMTTVTEEISTYTTRYRQKMEKHPNQSIEEIYSTEIPRRLKKRKHPIDLVPVSDRQHIRSR